jgi:DNA modification methylase
MTKKKPEAAAVWCPVEDLTPWDDNPRLNDEAVGKVRDSIKRFGFAAPIVARKEDGMVIAGHTRLRAAVELGLEKVPVRWMDLDPADARMLALADNKLGEVAAWDDDLLRKVLEDLASEPDLDLSGLGWEEEDLEAILGDDDPTGPEDGDLTEPPEEPDSAVGEVYELGPHRLVCGDCRDPSVVSRLLDGQSINVALTSPPYASQRKYDESSGFRPIPPAEYVEWFDAVQANVREHLAADGSWFVNIKESAEGGARNLYVKDLTLAHARQWGWRFVDEFCWRNTANGVPGTWPDRFKNAWEPVFHYSTGAPRFRPGNVKHATVDAFNYGEREASRTGTPFMRGGARKDGAALPSNVVEARPELAGIHSAPFPLALPDFFIRAFSDAGDIIFDPFLGSGTTLVAAAKTDRVAYGCEISAGYCDVIRRRWTTWADEAGVDPGPGALR